MRFIHVSDVHLGITPDKGKPWSDVRAKEIEDTFDRVLAVAAPHRRRFVSSVARGYRA